ncbi:glycosyltransferase family 2 protein [Bacteroides stercorirosoris]|jgi:glycosyltransferase involved in cell wall biosynthesis|uniref:glycosyltransferase family 2 protein n=1 Tax=Bacteroides stercorirosoris TaxID=871324 RepID=UPI0023F2BCEF|nr:glycosyltransferase family 2 protein [Bacteroides stercorirosoris]
MFFSIIVPCFNSENFINKTTSMLTQQSFNDFEVIFIDDGSSDYTFDILASISKSVPYKTTILQNTKNSGPGITKGVGVDKSKGDYLLFMDSDDWFEPEALQLLYTHLSQHHSDIVFFDAYRAYDTGKKILISNSEAFNHCQTNSDYIALAKGCLPYMCFKSELWSGITFPALYNAEDIAVIPILISKAKNISVLASPLYNYYYRVESLSNTPSADIYKSFLRSYKYTCEKMIVGKFDEALEFHGIKNVLYGAILNALRAGVGKNIFIDIIDDFEQKYPFWISNKYISYLPLVKRIFLTQVLKKRFHLLMMYVKLHRFALEHLKI